MGFKRDREVSHFSLQFAMGLQSLLPHNLHFITEELRQTYSDVLLKIAQDLKREEQEELQFLCTHKINSETTTVTDTLNIFIELERIGKISWENVCFLKKILTQLLRSNLAESLLTKYEIMRDVTLLLGLYANKRHGWNANQRISSSVEKLSDYLFNVTKETSRTCTEGDKLDLTFNVSVLGEEDIKEMLVEFEQEIESKFTSDSLSKLTMLVVVAGELVFEAFVNGEKRDATNICFIAFDKIYHRMQELRIGWVSLNSQFLYSR